MFLILIHGGGEHQSKTKKELIKHLEDAAYDIGFDSLTSEESKILDWFFNIDKPNGKTFYEDK